MPECLESLKQLPEPRCSTGSQETAAWWAQGWLGTHGGQLPPLDPSGRDGCPGLAPGANSAW